MATTERDPAAGRSRAAVVVLAVLAVAALAAVLLSLRKPPQMGADGRAMRTVDALYTAVRARDERRLGECEQRLRDHRDAGRLPADAADYLDRVIAQARGGDWDAAAERLYEFMLAQRREGAGEPGEDAGRKRDPKPKAKGRP